MIKDVVFSWDKEGFKFPGILKTPGEYLFISIFVLYELLIMIEFYRSE